MYSIFGTLLKDVEGSCISGNQKKGTSFIRKPNNKTGTLLMSSNSIYGRMLLTWLLFSTRAPVVVLGSKLRLPMSSSWPVFPGLDQALFPPWFSWFLGFDSKTVQRSALCRSRRELSNEYFLAKFDFDPAENEPCEVCPLSVYRSVPSCSKTFRWIVLG